MIHEIIAKLHVAYTLIHKGMEEEDMLLVEEGFGYLAEAKAMLEEPEPNPNEVVVSNIDAMSDALYAALDLSFKQELVAQGKDPDVSWQHWTIKAQYEPK